jgi:hypothetical protein
MLDARPILFAALATLSLTWPHLTNFAIADEPADLGPAKETITAAELQDLVGTLADDVFEGRGVGTRGGRAAAQYIVKELRKTSLQPAGTKGDYFHACDRGGRNILVMLPGTDPTLKDQFIVIGAHYDHVADGRMGHANGPIGRIHNGADDNASGVAALLETIEALSEAKLDTRRSILFAFWDGEEMGMLGSKRWFRAPTIPTTSIKLGVNIDMIGRLRDRRLEVDGTRTGYGLRRFVSRNNDPSLYLDFSWELQANSDHWSFVEHQIPIVMLHTGLHPDYHRPSDDADKINRQGLESVTRYLLDIIVTAANADTLPAYRTARRFDSLATQKSRQQRDAATSRGDWPGVAPPRLGITWRTDEAEPGSVYLTHVAASSPAATAGLAAGDRVYAVNDQPFTNEGDFRDTVYGLLDASATEFTLLVETRGHTRTLVVRLQPQTLAAQAGS